MLFRSTRGKVTAAGGQYNDRLSLVADYNRTGFVGPYGGDFFVPDYQIEGNQQSSSKPMTSSKLYAS